MCNGLFIDWAGPVLDMSGAFRYEAKMTDWALKVSRLYEPSFFNWAWAYCAGLSVEIFPSSV
ncbi:hypothetical protein Csa_019417 [Cucumis sativus]|uniref:Uncharacterized protein n=1 Tax=Cucumis sativus TaxID=3659 RepID=A0A0A0LIT7_CUCSA|nr:hypothetical protein Csa_019417 [Cucumis sativus]